MTRAPASVWLSLCALLAWPLAAQPQHRFDPDHTRFGFEVRTRWGQRVTGTFPQYAGEVLARPGDRHVVRIRLATGAVEVAGSPRSTALARGAGFFDAPRHPSIEFVSDPYPEHLLRAGGPLRGRLTIHGITHQEVFAVAPATCERPGRDCDVVAGGTVSRADYGLDGWQFALRNRVRFELRVRVQEATP